MSERHHPRPHRRYGEQPRSQAGRHFIQTQVRTDVYLRVRELMEAHNLSASGAVHHLLRERLGLPPLPPFDQQPVSTNHPDPTHG
ncbi:hypothetical protein [Synechococcus sp. A15-44]|uniref:hypothetical protein n=1 Tax=Synechococcus sp. A15-44 TaxID=1050646 RepID=UPI0016462882|nr:hypothetical protein [Synechococcus sp. A15-44]QNI63557.1 hypothetical protein SynA1544_00615 [Synechococcus sp. A15-44]